jgi:hypothetical protein
MKKGEISFEINGNHDNKKLSINKPKLSNEVNISALDVDRISNQIFFIS